MKKNSTSVVKTNPRVFTISSASLEVEMQQFMTFQFVAVTKRFTIKWLLAIIMFICEVIGKILYKFGAWFLVDFLFVFLLAKGIQNIQNATQKDWRLHWDGIARLFLFGAVVTVLVASCSRLVTGSSLTQRKVQPVDDKMEYLDAALEDSTTVDNLSRLIKSSSELLKRDSVGAIRPKQELAKLDILVGRYTLKAKLIAVLVLAEDCSDDHFVVGDSEDDQMLYSGVTGVYTSQEDAWDGDLDALYEGAEQDLELFKPVFSLSVIEATIDSFQIMERLYKSKKFSQKKPVSPSKTKVSQKKSKPKEVLKRSVERRSIVSSRRVLVYEERRSRDTKKRRNSKNRLIVVGKVYRHVLVPSIRSSSEPYNPNYRAVRLVTVKDPKTGQILQEKGTCSTCEEEYILNNYRLAQKLQQEGGAPAAVTLAQGGFESCAGRSRLAVLAHNYYGIKGSSSRGHIRATDDAPGERFRKFASPDECMRYHEQLLKGAMYSGLKSIPSWDYVAYSNELNRVGYATIWTYSEDLISVIERLELWRFNDPNFRPDRSGDELVGR